MAIQSFLNENFYDKIQECDVKLSSLLDSNVVGLFLNADWSKPGRKFSNELNQVYMESAKRKLNFKLIYVSFDKDQENFFENFDSKFDPAWIVWPFDSSTKR
jgi:hypothetical protein